jgi:lipocalin
MCGTDFLFLQSLGTWYVLLHTPNDFENNLECVLSTYALSEENITLITLQAYDIR